MEREYLEELYEKGAATLGTTVSHLKFQDKRGPMCESCNPICVCIDHKCCWFIKCYPQYKDTVAKEWLPEGY